VAHPDELGDLEGARHPARIREVRPSCPPRREPTQARDRGSEPLAREHPLDRGARIAVGGQRVGVEPARDAAQVQSRAADEDRQAILLGDAGEGRARVPDEVRHGEGLVGLHEIQPVVRHVAAIRRGHLGRPDVEAAKDLA